MDAALLEMLTDVLLVAPVTGRNAHGEVTYGPPVARKGRIHTRLDTVFGTTGRQIVPTTKVFFNGDFVLTEADQIVFPDGTAPPIQGIEPHPDEQGHLDHYTVYF